MPVLIRGGESWSRSTSLCRLDLLSTQPRRACSVDSPKIPFGAEGWLQLIPHSAFRVPRSNGGRDGTCPRFLLRDREASRLLRPHAQKIRIPVQHPRCRVPRSEFRVPRSNLVGSGSNALLVVFPDLFNDGRFTVGCGEHRPELI